MESSVIEPAATILDDSGKSLDAHFRVEEADAHGLFLVVFASSGGARSNPRARNLEYVAGLDQILIRLADRRAVITEAFVDSRRARLLPESDRRIDLAYPIPLNPESDVIGLRRAITQGQRSIARADSAQANPGGNNRKRIRLTVKIDPPSSGAGSLEDFLSAGAARPRRSPLGPYRRPQPAPSASSDPWSRDPAVLDRSRFAHAETQDSLFDHLLRSGIEPCSPTGDPDFDLAWSQGDESLWVAEVKSLTDTNENQQLRLGLGQVLHYKAQFERDNPDLRVRPLLALERPPSDQIWWSVTRSAGVMMSWPPDWPGVIVPA